MMSHYDVIIIISPIRAVMMPTLMIFTKTVEMIFGMAVVMIMIMIMIMMMIMALIMII